MRRLDQSLARLAERGEPAGAEVLLDRVAHQLETGSEGVVVALDARRTNVDTQVPKTTTRTRGPWIAIAGFAAAVVALAAIVVLVQRPTEEALLAGRPPGPLDDFYTGLVSNDVEAATAVMAPSFNPGFIPFMIGLDTSEVEFSGCEIDDSQRVTCATVWHEPWFYSRLAGHQLTSTFSITIGDDGLMRGGSWPHPPALVQLEQDFEAWVLQTYPERYDEMFTEVSTVAHILFSFQSGAARNELADEYLAYLADQG